MKIINKPRAAGKTTQLLYVSSFNEWPIICMDNNHRNNLESRAKQLGLEIPRPITVCELSRNGTRDVVPKHFLMDEAAYVLENIIRNITGGGCLEGIALTSPMTGSSFSFSGSNLD